MPGGRGKKKRNSKDSTEGKKKGTGRKKGRGGGGGSSGKSVKVQADIFSEGAMENAYLLCHNVQVNLTYVIDIYSNSARCSCSCILYFCARIYRMC